jgi:hypothetical protein
MALVPGWMALVPGWMAAVPGWMAAVPVLVAAVVAWNLAALWSSAHFCINAQAFPVGFQGGSP